MLRAVPASNTSTSLENAASTTSTARWVSSGAQARFATLIVPNPGRLVAMTIVLRCPVARLATTISVVRPRSTVIT